LSKKRSNYNTKQSQAVLDFLEINKSKPLTAVQIAEHFNNKENSVGRTTVYRQLDRLVKDGYVRKYTIQNRNATCFQFIPEEQRTDTYNMKCECCDRIFNFHCNALSESFNHILEEHNFKINDFKTIFYGKCTDCIKKSITQKDNQ
jgi:Fur family ferric uptake transcriptional regulator